MAPRTPRAARPLLQLDDVDRLGALWRGLFLVGDLDALGQGAVTVGGDARVMDKQVATAVIGRDEPEALLVAEPFDCAVRHCGVFLRGLKCCYGGVAARSLHLLDAARSSGDLTRWEGTGDGGSNVNPW